MIFIYLNSTIKLDFSTNKSYNIIKERGKTLNLK